MQFIKYLLLVVNLLFLNVSFASTLLIEWDSHHNESLVATFSVMDVKKDPDTINLSALLTDNKEIPVKKISKHHKENVISFVIERNDLVNEEDKISLHLTSSDEDIIKQTLKPKLSGLTVIKDNEIVDINALSLVKIDDLNQLAEAIKNDFEKNTSNEQKAKIKKITVNTRSLEDKAQVFFELGTVAFEKKHLYLSNYLLLQATQLNKDKLLYQSWLINSIKSLPRYRLNNTVMQLLEKDFTDRIHTQWANHHKTPDKHPIPTQFAVSNLVDLRLGLANLASDDQQKLAWINKARQKNLLPAGELQEKYKAPISLFTQARAEVAESNHYRDIARSQLNTFRQNPAFQQEKALRKQYNDAVKEANVLKEKLENAYKQKRQSAEIKAIEDKINTMKKDDDDNRQLFNDNRKKINAIKESNKTVKRDLDAQQENAKKEELINQYNANVEKVNKIAAENKALANKINTQTKNIQAEYDKLNTTLKKMQDELYAPYDKLVNKVKNELKPALDKTVANLQQQQNPVKDAYKTSDLYFDRAKKLLSARKTPINEAKSVNKIKSFEKPISFADAKPITTTNRPWCNRLSYYCDACFGLEVVNCELDQQKAVAQCNAGEEYSLYFKGYGSGGLIGACKGIFIVAADTQLGHFDDYHDRFIYESYGDFIKRKHQAALMQDALAELLGLEDSDSSDKEKIKKLLWRLMNETDPDIRGAGFLLSELVALGEEEQDGGMKPLLDGIENASGDKEKKFAIEKAADKLSGLLSHYVRGTDPETFTSSDVENLTNVIKYGGFLADDLKDANPLTAEKNGVSKLFTALHGVAAVYDGAKNKDGLVLVDGMRDLLDSVPNVSSNPALAPITAVLDLPATTVVSINKVNQQGFNQASSVLSDLSKGIGGDQAALDRAVRNSQKMETILSPQNYVRTAVDGVKNRLLDKIPFARTVVAWFSS